MKSERILSFLLTVLILVFIMPKSTMKAHAICCRKDGFDKSRYTLTGNMAEDVATIAKSQKGRFCDDFGYTGVDWGAWCDEYVADCLENAGCDSSIVAHGGTVADFADKLTKRGAVPVSTPQTGDIVFFTYSHVEIVTKVTNGVVYSAGGNNRDPYTNIYHDGGCCAGEHIATSISYYLRPAYINASLSAPEVYTNLKSYVPGADIDINWNYVAGATGYWIDIWKGGEHILSSNLGKTNTYTLTKAESAEYGVFVAAYKDDANWESVCSECCRFSVHDVNAPEVYTNYLYYAPNAEVDIMWNLIEDATGYWIDIWKGDEHVLSESLNDPNCSKYTYQCTEGTYGVFVSAYSENGGWSSACSNCHNFYVQEVTAPSPTTVSNYYTPQTDVEVKWDKIDSATGYWIDIWKDGEHTISENIGDVLSYTVLDVDKGSYEVYVASYNDIGGWTTAHNDALCFTVKDAPSQPELTANVNNSTLTLSWDSCTNTDYYGVRIMNYEDGSYIIYKEPYEDTNYEYVLPVGEYYANIASVQKDGFYTFSDDVYLKIESSAVIGDCNNDGTFNVTDIVLLQKWLLSIPDTQLCNWQAADLNEDGELDVFDLSLMKRKLLNS